MNNADLATRYTQALIAKLEQTTDPMMVAVLTHKIEERMNAPTVRQERAPDLAPNPGPNRPSAPDSPEPPQSGNWAAAHGAGMPRGAIRQFVIDRLSSSPMSVAGLAAAALKAGLWPDSPEPQQARDRMNMTLQRGKASIFERDGDGAWKLTAAGRAAQAGEVPAPAASPPPAPAKPLFPPDEVRGFLQRELRQKPLQTILQLGEAALAARIWGGEMPSRATAIARVYQTIMRNASCFDGETRGSRVKYWRSL